MRLFVYGTRIRGEQNHAQLDGASFVADHVTERRFTLVDLGPYPAMLEEGTTAVHGELYDVDAALLAALDRFEGHPTLFRRGPLSLVRAPGPRVETYFLARARAARLRASRGLVVLASGKFRGARLAPAELSDFARRLATAASPH